MDLVYLIMGWTVLIVIGIVVFYYMLNRVLGENVANGLMLSLLLMICVLPPVVKYMMKKYRCVPGEVLSV